jgi:hypothetical protein
MGVNSMRGPQLWSYGESKQHESHRRRAENIREVGNSAVDVYICPPRHIIDELFPGWSIRY